MNDSNKFEEFMDRQSGEDAGFLIRKPSLWKKFIQTQEDRHQASDNRVRFIFTEKIGLQNQVVDWEDRSTERYVFSHHCMLDHRGKKLSPIDCVLMPTLSFKRDAQRLLKEIKYVFNN